MRGDGKISNRASFGFTTLCDMTRMITSFMSQLHGFEGFGKSSDLIDLNENGIGRFVLECLFEYAFYLSHK